VSPKNLFSFFLLAAAGGKEKKKEKLGTPQTPAGRSLHSFQDVFKWHWSLAARQGDLNSYKAKKAGMAGWTLLCPSAIPGR
jgi:hypothetical protein